MRRKRQKGPPGRARATRPGRSFRPDWERVWPLAALFGLALVLRLAGVHSGLPEVFEEAYPFKKAWAMWGWGPGGHFDPNPHWFRYPGLVIYLQLAGQALLYGLLRIAGQVHSILDYRVLYEMDKTSFYLMARSITAVLGAATVVPVWHMARRVGGTAAAWCAGIIVAVSAVLVEKSWVVEVDVPMALLLAIACLQALRLVEAPTRRNALVGGVLVGLAAAAKYPGAIGLVPVLIGLVLGLHRVSAPAGEEAPPATRVPAGAWAATIALVVAGAAVAFFVASPFSLLDFRNAISQIGSERQHMALGHFGSEGGHAWGYYARNWFAGALGWPAGIAALAGLVWFTFVRRASWAVVLGAPILIYYATVGSWAMKADRYLIPLVPIGAVFAAALVAVLLGWRALARLPRTAAWIAMTVVLALPLTVDLAGRLRDQSRETRGAARRWIEANIPRGAFIATEFYAPELMSPGVLEEIPPDLIGPIRKGSRMRPLYASLYLPMYQVHPERSAPFYDFRLLEPVDYIVVTDPVRHRYEDDPKEFPRQIAFYDTLDSHWVKVKSFEGGPTGKIVVYRNPAHDKPFAARRDMPPVEELLDPATTAPEGAGYFYYYLGLNYEAFGHRRHAFDAYLEGMRFPPTPQGYNLRSTLAAARLLERSGRPDQAARFLSEAEAHTTDPHERKAIEDARITVERKLRRGNP